MNKEKVIIYGMGQAYKQIGKYIEYKFNVVAYADKNKINPDVILPEDIKNIEYDKIIITSSKYFFEIKDALVNEYCIDAKKICSIYDIWGDFRNGEMRDEWVIEHISKISNDKIILDAGAGESKYKKYCKHLKYIAQDFGEYIPNEIKMGLQNNKWDYSELNIKCDITDIPLEDNSVDVVLCTEVFEHLPNPMLALKEFSRLIKQGGELILTAPFCCLTHMAPYFYYNGFSDFWYKEYLEKYGFEIIESKSCGNYFKYLQQELFRLDEVCLRYADYNMTNEEINKINDVISLLSNYSGLDKGSDELLRFGTFICARKI